MAKKIAKPAPKPAAKPAAKPAPKPAAKPAAKPLAKATPAPTPAPATNQQSQLDLVRNPNFDAAMAQRDYANLMRDQQARIAAELGLGGAPLTQSEIDKKYVDDGRGGRVLNAEDAAKLKLQFDQLRANIAANPDPARNFDIDYIEGGQRYAPVNQGPQVGGGMGGQGNFRADVAQNQFIDPQSPQGQAMQGYQQSLRNALSGYNPNVPSLMPIPQAQQMPVPDQQQGARADQYQNLLQQGLASYAAQNYPQQQQGAMGAQAAQNYAGGPMPSPAIPSSKTMGGVTAQPRGVPRPRQPKGFRSPIGRSAF